MYSILEIALINAVMVVPLALVAAVVGRFFHRPALTHLLWVLLLIKLITPPLIQIPLVDREWVTATSRQLVPPLLAKADLLINLERLDRLNWLQDATRSQKAGESAIDSLARPRPRTLADRDKQFVLRRTSLLAAVSRWIWMEALPQIITAGLMTIWAVGAIVWFSLQGYRCVRFRWSLARGAAAGAELQRFSDQLARRLGLSQSPVVWLMPGVMSPMLWGSGQSALLIYPERLLHRLNQEATGTLLTHELAHFRRGDHWVRVLELMVTGFFWWHPVVWWARREIEAVEEECCDARVVAAATSAPKRYAEAILETIDFLQENQLRLPPLATGLSQFPFLRQRLTWIMRGRRRQDFGRCGRVLCLILACNLPFQPTWLAARAPEPTLQRSSEQLPRIDETPKSQSPGGNFDAGLSDTNTLNATLADPEAPHDSGAMDRVGHSVAFVRQTIRGVGKPVDSDSAGPGHRQRFRSDAVRRYRDRLLAEYSSIRDRRRRSFPAAVVCRELQCDPNLASSRQPAIGRYLGGCALDRHRRSRRDHSKLAPFQPASLPSVAERVVSDQLRPILTRWRHAGCCDRWFRFDIFRSNRCV